MLLFFRDQQKNANSAQRRCSKSGEAENGLLCRRRLASSDSFSPVVECDVNTSSSSNETRRRAEHTYFDDDAEQDCEANCSSSVLADISTNNISTENVHKPKSLLPRRTFKRKRLSSKGSEILDVSSCSTVSKKSQHTKKRKKISSVTVEGNVDKKERENFIKTLSKELVADVKRDVIDRLFSSPLLIKLSMLDDSWTELCTEQLKRSNRNGSMFKITRFFRDENPFVRTFVEEDGNMHAKSFHDDVRLLVRMLRYLLESKWGAGDEGSSFMLDGFTPNALGWLCLYSEEQLPRCPVVLQEKIRDLFLRDFPRTSKYVYSPAFLKPETFVDVVAFRRDVITSLNLGELEVHGRPLIRLSFPNLRELIWHNADMFELASWNTPELTLLSVTASSSSMSDFDVLADRPKLEYLYTGLKVPDDPTRFDLDVLLRSYQAFWNTPVLAAKREDWGGGNEPDYAISAIPSVRRIAFWNAPEKLFALMAKNNISFDTVQFGQLNQALTRLCSLDSIMQALFKFNQPKYECYKLEISHLKLYLHAMPVVSLDYYLPQLMMGINDAMTSIRSLDLFVHCSFSASMPTSWVLEGRQKNSCSKLKNLTHFSLHIDGFCVFNDLDCHLPPSLTCVSVSVSLPVIGARRSLSSLMDLVKRLANVNAYPDLEELHLQVWGIRCAEQLLNHVADHLSDVRRLSIIAMPLSEQRDRLIDLIRHVASSCPRLVSLQLSVEMMLILVWGIRCAEQLLNHVADHLSDVRRLSIIAMPLSEQRDRLIDLIRHVASSCPRLVSLQLSVEMMLILLNADMRDTCDFGVNSLPHVSDCAEYIVKPSYPE
ncbi:hypothetical protein OSTOST_03726, partial [Ostertagia ostertagi]